MQHDQMDHPWCPPRPSCGHLVPIAVHGQQAEQVEGMAALREAAHGHWPNGLAVSHVTVPRHHGQFLHTDDAVLEGEQTQGTLTKSDIAPKEVNLIGKGLYLLKCQS